MACVQNLNSRLTGQDPGGSWYYLGRSGTAGGPYTYNVAEAPSCDGGATLVQGNPAANTGAISCPTAINFDNAATGFHGFVYEVEVGSCSATAAVEIEVLDQPSPGIPPATQQYCTTDSAFTIWTLWSSAPGDVGTWDVSSTGTASLGYTAGATIDLDTFDPSAAGTGTYTFVHTVTTPGNTYPVNCADCTQTATITIEVIATPSAGTPSNITVCNNL